MADKTLSETIKQLIAKQDGINPEEITPEYIQRQREMWVKEWEEIVRNFPDEINFAGITLTKEYVCGWVTYSAIVNVPQLSIPAQFTLYPIPRIRLKK